jgi:hypothetical protein
MTPFAPSEAASSFKRLTTTSAFACEVNDQERRLEEYRIAICSNCLDGGSRYS